MHLPFQRTFSQRKTLGNTQVISLALVVILHTIKKRAVFVPESTVVTVNGFKMQLFPRRGGIDYELFLYKKREPTCTDYLQNSGILQQGDTVLDIGANIGYYALLESALVGSTGKVYAVEPVQETFNALTKNIKLNNLQNIESSRYAFGDTVKTGQIYLSRSSNLCAVNKESVGGLVMGHEVVSFLTVDAFLKGKKQPSLVRMDVEGYEYEIAKGMKQTLQGNVRILVELHPAHLGEKLDGLLCILERQGFRVRYLVIEGKVKHNMVMRALLRKSGNILPVVFENLSFKQLRRVISVFPDLSPNVVLEKIDV